MSALAVGLMSGTSLDGIDAALVRIDDERSVVLERFLCLPYADDDRDQIAHAIESGSAAQLAQVDVHLGERFAGAVERLLHDAGVEAGDVEVVGSHGQTVWHEPGRASLQLGDAAIVAERTGIPVVSDFRRRDIAAGGQGAPLVPMADVMLFAPADGPRLLLNVGGMANLTWVERGGQTTNVVAFDTGPGVAVIDGAVACADATQRMDRDGIRAARGSPVAVVVERALAHAYFATSPPKSTGREIFGGAFARQVYDEVRAAGGSADDAVATAVSIVVRSITTAVERWIPVQSGEVIISGGGARNPTLVHRLGEALGPEWALRSFDDVFFDGDAKEAVTFAYLAWRTLRHLPGNVPAATGATKAVVLGTLTR